MTKRQHFRTNAGIAIGPILFVIAILALLAAAIAAGSGSFTSGTTTESDTTNAQALVNYTDQLKSAVQVVMSANGCADTQLNFYASADVNPTNPTAPSDHSCDIYDPRGGGVQYHNFAALPIFDATRSSSIRTQFGISIGQFTQNYVNVMADFGSNPALLFIIYGLTQSECTAINKIVGYNPPTYAPPSKMMWEVYINHIGFTGTYPNLSSNSSFGMQSSHQGCYYDPNASMLDYEYMGVLLAR